MGVSTTANVGVSVGAKRAACCGTAARGRQPNASTHHMPGNPFHMSATMLTMAPPLSDMCVRYASRQHMNVPVRFVSMTCACAPLCHSRDGTARKVVSRYRS